MQSVDTDSLCNAALQRFGSIPDYVDVYIENLCEGLSMGFSSPRWNIVRVLEQLDVLLESPLKYSPFFGPAQRNPTPTFQKVFTSLIKQTINPAIDGYQSFQSEEYIPQVLRFKLIKLYRKRGDTYAYL